MTNQVNLVSGKSFPEGALYYIRSNENVEIGYQEINLSITQALAIKQPESIANQLRIDQNDAVQFSFMNYGNTELVYELSINQKQKYAFLINQPHTPKEVVKNQFHNLKRLHQINPKHIIKPIAEFENNKYAMYLTELIPNSLCIGNNRPRYLGVWNPQPRYKFEEFNQETTDKVNISRIAHIINAYDNEHELGIAKMEISGNDFMLREETDFANLQSIIENTIIISARDNIHIPFEDYMFLVREEFQRETYRDYKKVKKNILKINHHSQMAIPIKIIDEGIKKGLELRVRK